MKVFAERQLYSVADKILPYSDFKLFRELDKYEFNERKMKHVVEKAEKYLDMDIPLLPASLYRQFATIGNRSNYESLFFRRRSMALDLAIAEYYEKKGRFAESLWTLFGQLWRSQPG